MLFPEALTLQKCLECHFFLGDAPQLSARFPQAKGTREKCNELYAEFERI